MTPETANVPPPKRLSTGEFLRGWPLRVGGIVLVIAVVAVAFRAASRHGPDERDRFTHPSGYSIVAPKDWRTRVVLDPGNPTEIDGLILEPVNWKGSAPNMWAKRLKGAPDEAAMRPKGFIDWQFQGQPSLHLLEKKRRGAVQREIFQRNGQWYEVGVELPGIEWTSLDDWWKFAETFKPAGAGGKT